MSATIFDPAAEAYDRLRPSYPPGLYDGIETLSGRSLDGAVVVEVGAGTGIATAELVARGASVLAVDLSLEMLRHQRVPSAAVVGSGGALPVRSHAADLVCCAQAWHWLPRASGIAEAVRALGEAGALALWWNDYEASWTQDADPRRIFDDAGRPRPAHAVELDHDGVDGELRASGCFSEVHRLEVPWQRSVSIDARLEQMSTHSWVIELGPEQPDLLRYHRAQLEKAWPDGMVHERYVCKLHMALVA
jgi:SAM-dependent methyltransferase